jgi:predicted RNase H-like HicB family nuclease
MMAKYKRFRLLHYFLSVNRRGKHVAHCLNFDIVATADTMEEAERRLDALVKVHIEGFLKSSGMSGLGEPAPKEFWVHYTDCLRQGGALPASWLRIEIPKVIPMDSPYGELEIVSAKAA